MLRKPISHTATQKPALICGMVEQVTACVADVGSPRDDVGGHRQGDSAMSDVQKESTQEESEVKKEVNDAEHPPAMEDNGSTLDAQTVPCVRHRF